MNITKESADMLQAIVTGKKDKKPSVKKVSYDYVGKEDDFQIAVMDYIKVTYPHALVIHAANERKTHQKQNKKGKWYSPDGNKLKKKGVKAGVCDILIFEPHCSFNVQQIITYVGCAIELKVKPNKISPEQQNFLNLLSLRGWKTNLCYGLNEAIEIIDKYLKK